MADSRTLTTTGPPAQVGPEPSGLGQGGGVIIEASLLARLLGMRLLTLEGTIVLSSADVTSLDHWSHQDGVDLQPVSSATDPPIEVVPPDLTIGPALAEASRLIADADALLGPSRSEEVAARDAHSA